MTSKASDNTVKAKARKESLLVNPISLNVVRTITSPNTGRETSCEQGRPTRRGDGEVTRLQDQIGEITPSTSPTPTRLRPQGKSQSIQIAEKLSSPEQETHEAAWDQVRASVIEAKAIRRIFSSLGHAVSYRSPSLLCFSDLCACPRSYSSC